MRLLSFSYNQTLLVVCIICTLAIAPTVAIDGYNGVRYINAYMIHNAGSDPLGNSPAGETECVQKCRSIITDGIDWGAIRENPLYMCHL